MRRVVPNIKLIVANIIFGISYSIILRMLEAKVSYQTIFTLQIVVSALIFIPIALLSRERQRVAPHDMAHIAICGIITIYGWSLLTLRGITTSSPIDIASLSTLSPTITILAATISKTWANSSIRHRHLTKSQARYIITPLMLVIIAGMVIMGEIPHFANLDTLRQNAPIIIAVVCMGVSTVIITPQHQRYGTPTILAIYFAVASMMLPLVVDIPDIVSHFAALRISPRTALLPIVTMTIPIYLLYSGALQLTPLHTALYRYIQPVISFIVIIYLSNTRLDTPSISTLADHILATLLLTLSLLLLSTRFIPWRLIK